LGGTFIVSNYRKLAKFKWHLWRGPTVSDTAEEKLLKIIKCDIKNLSNLKGIIVSQSNTRVIHRDGHGITIFLGHGTGDKKYGGNPEILLSYDYHFISGPKHLAKLEDVGIRIPEDRLIPIGNPRFDNYLSNVGKEKSYLKYLGVRDISQPTVLYAPTWKWGGGTLRKLVYRLGRELSKDYNLIVRPHHFDAHLLPWLKFWARSKGLKHIYFSNPNNILHEDAMEVFASSDILISDTSSLIYEYLITGKPIIRVKIEDDQDLHSMPDEMTILGKSDVLDPENLEFIVDKIEHNLNDQPYKKVYKKLLSDCFFFNDGQSTNKAIDFLSEIGANKE
jgi:CDP-glycerol glycerophosphotransferase (TagB/SpsB family)